MDKFEVHLVEHCNLKCQCCDNYSSIAEEEYTNEIIFRNDMERMSQLFPEVKVIRLLGGEPLLHPNITFFLKVARRYFTDAEIRVTTNATLLSKMHEDFWKTCYDNKIIIEYTYYPIPMKRKFHKELGRKYYVVLTPAFDEYFTEFKQNKTSYRFTVSGTKDKDINYNWQNCPRRNWGCISLKNGKLYPCTCVPNIYHFNKFFHKNLEVTEQDSINIYTHNADEINEFLQHPIPFCGYCNIGKELYDIPWSITKNKLSEWYED